MSAFRVSFLQLPESLLTFALYPEFIKIAKVGSLCLQLTSVDCLAPLAPMIWLFQAVSTLYLPLLFPLSKYLFSARGANKVVVVAEGCGREMSACLFGLK